MCPTSIVRTDAPREGVKTRGRFGVDFRSVWDNVRDVLGSCLGLWGSLWDNCRIMLGSFWGNVGVVLGSFL